MAFGDIAKLLASLDLDTKPFERGAGRVSGDLSKMEGGLGRVSTRATILGTAIGQGLERLAEKGINVLFGAIRSGEDALHRLNDVQAQTAAVVKSTGGKAKVSAQQVRDLALSLENLTTADDKSIQSGENLLLTFTGIGKSVFPAATKAVVNLGIAMAQGAVANADFKSSAIQIGKALNDPIKGIGALSRVGVSFTEQQKKQITTLLSLTKEEQKHYLALRQTNKGAAERYKTTRINSRLDDAQRVILKELNKEFGKAGEAAGKSGAAGVRRLQDALEDAQVALVAGLEPALNDIRGQIASTLNDPETQRALFQLGEFLGDAAKSGIAFAKSIPWAQVADGLKTAAGFAGDLIKTFTNLPGGVQATIIGLAGLNKLAGGGVIKLSVDLFKGGIEKVLGAVFQRGSSPANPLFVAGSGIGGGGVPAAGGIGAAGKLFLIGEAIGLVAAVEGVRESIVAGLGQQATDIHGAVTEQINAQHQGIGALAQSLAGVNQGIDAITSNPLNVLVGGDALKQLEQMRAELGSALKAADDTNKANFRNQERADASHADTQKQKLDLVKTRLEDSERQLRTIQDKQQGTTAKVGDLDRTTSTGTDRVVSAIRTSKPVVNVDVVVNGSNVKVDTTYSNSNMGSGGGRHLKKP